MCMWSQPVSNVLIGRSLNMWRFCNYITILWGIVYLWYKCWWWYKLRLYWRATELQGNQLCWDYRCNFYFCNMSSKNWNILYLKNTSFKGRLWMLPKLRYSLYNKCHIYFSVQHWRGARRRHKGRNLCVKLTLWIWWVLQGTQLAFQLNKYVIMD